MKTCERVRQIRINKGLRQNYVAQKMGLKISTYNAIELGHRPLRADMLEQLANVLGVEPSDFFNQNFHETCNA